MTGKWSCKRASIIAQVVHLDDRSDTFHLGKLSIFTEELGEEVQED
jgi:hypothetical protein